MNRLNRFPARVVARLVTVAVLSTAAVAAALVAASPVFAADPTYADPSSCRQLRHRVRVHGKLVSRRHLVCS